MFESQKTLQQQGEVQTAKNDTSLIYNSIDQENSSDYDEKTIPIISDDDDEAQDYSIQSSSTDDDDALLFDSDEKKIEVKTLKQNYQNITKKNKTQLETKKQEIFQKRRPKQIPGKVITISVKDYSFLEKRIFFSGQTPTNCTFTVESDQFKNFKYLFVRHMFTSNTFLIDWLEKRFKTKLRAFVSKKFPDRVNQLNNDTTLYLRYYDKNLKEMLLIDLKNPRYDLRNYIDVSSDDIYYISVIFDQI